MPVLSYNGNRSKVHIWVRTRSGSNMSMVFSDAKFSFNGDWKRVDVTEKQLQWIKVQNKLIEIKTEDPIKPFKAITPKINLQSISFSRSKSTLVIGDNTSIELETKPANTDLSSFKVEITSDRVKTASCEALGPTISISAHSEGTTNIRATIGAMTAITEVKVVQPPKFIQEEFSGVVNTEIDLITTCPPSDVVLTTPENVSVVEGTTKVLANKVGTYEIIASAYGRTLATRLVVSEDTTETPTN